MVKQSSFAEFEYQSKKCLTRREVFLNEMEAVMPWAVLMAVIEPHYPKQGKVGRPPKGLSCMLHIHCMRHWFSYSDRQMEERSMKLKAFAAFLALATSPNYYREIVMKWSLLMLDTPVMSTNEARA